jgi:hypothetical protein
MSHMDSPVKKRAKLSDQDTSALFDANEEETSNEKLLRLVDDLILSSKPEDISKIKGTLTLFVQNTSYSCLEKIKCLPIWSYEKVRNLFDIAPTADFPLYKPKQLSYVPQPLLKRIVDRLEEDRIVAGRWDRGTEQRPNSTVDSVCALLLPCLFANKFPH